MINHYQALWIPINHDQPILATGTPGIAGFADDSDMSESCAQNIINSQWLSTSCHLQINSFCEDVHISGHMSVWVPAHCWRQTGGPYPGLGFNTVHEIPRMSRQWAMSGHKAQGLLTSPPHTSVSRFSAWNPSIVTCGRRFSCSDGSSPPGLLFHPDRPPQAFWSSSSCSWCETYWNRPTKLTARCMHLCRHQLHQLLRFTDWGVMQSGLFRTCFGKVFYGGKAGCPGCGAAWHCAAAVKFGLGVCQMCGRMRF